jgi:hypothetical protein
VVTGKDIGGKITSGDVTKMKGAVGIGPSHSNKDPFSHRGKQRP